MSRARTVGFQSAGLQLAGRAGAWLANGFDATDNRRMRRIVIFALAAALSTVFVSGQNDDAAQDTPVFKTDVALVKVDAEVIDGTKLLDGFLKDDFRIFDNGRQQSILYFSQGEEPLDLVLMFDLSGSMIPKLQKLSESAHVALAELRQGDRVAVMVFGSKSSVVLPFTEDLNAVEGAINSATKMRMGGTHILVAINDAAALFLKEKRTQRRRAVMIVTDNHGQISSREITAVHNLWEADAVLSGLQVRFPGETALLVARRVNPYSMPASLLLDGENMSGVAAKTGGEVLRGDASVEFAELMHRLRLRYTLYYAMPKGKPGEERRIRVALTAEAKNRNPQGRVSARMGYRVPKAQ